MGMNDTHQIALSERELRIVCASLVTEEQRLRDRAASYEGADAVIAAAYGRMAAANVALYRRLNELIVEGPAA